MEKTILIVRPRWDGYRAEVVGWTILEDRGSRSWGDVLRLQFKTTHVQPALDCQCDRANMID
jgi:hypothetical protein